MRNVRTALAAATTLSLLSALSSGPALAATTGVGTASADTIVIGVDLGSNGSLLGVRLLGDAARSTIDPKTASTPEAFSRFTGLNVLSSVPDLNKSSGTDESRQPGGEKEVTRGSVNLANPAKDVTLDSSVVSGTIGLASLSSTASPALAKSSLTTTLSNAVMAGALATVKGVTSSIGTSASTTASETTRAVTVDQVVVLDLGALLDGLGLSLLDLPTSTVVGLLDTLDTIVPGVGDAQAVQDAIDDLQAEITALTGQSSLPTGTTVGGVVDTINGLGLGELVPPSTESTIDAQTGVTQVNSLIDQLQAALAVVLRDGVEALDDAPLLRIDGAEVSVATKAADTVANSTTATTGKIGSFWVGGVAIPGTDLSQTITQIDATTKTVNDKLKEVLGGIDPGLADVVKVTLFERVANRAVTSSGGYVRAVDGVTVLSASVTPPAALSTIVAGIKSATGVGDELTADGQALPVLSDSMTTMEGLLGSGTQAAAGGAGVRVAQVLGTSEFAVGAAGFGGDPDSGDDTSRSLARTGSNDSLPMTALAALLIALGLGLREWTRMPVPARVQTTRRPHGPHGLR